MAILKRAPRELKHDSEMFIPDELNFELIETYSLSLIKSLNRRFFHPQDECLDCGVRHAGADLPNFYFQAKFKTLEFQRKPGNGIYILRCTSCLHIVDARKRREDEVRFQRKLQDTFEQLKPHLELPENGEFVSGQILLSTPHPLSGMYVRTALYDHLSTNIIVCTICKTQNYHLRSNRPAVSKIDPTISRDKYYETEIICSECTYSEARKLDEEKRKKYYAEREEAMKLAQKRQRAVSVKLRKLLDTVEFTVPNPEEVENAC